MHIYHLLMYISLQSSSGDLEKTISCSANLNIWILSMTNHTGTYDKYMFIFFC